MSRVEKKPFILFHMLNMQSIKLIFFFRFLSSKKILRLGCLGERNGYTDINDILEQYVPANVLAKDRTVYVD